MEQSASGQRRDRAGEPAPPTVDRSEAEALLATRRDLGAEYEDALLESFVDRVEAAVAERGGAVARREDSAAALERAASHRRWVLALASLAIGVPLTAISAAIVGLLGVIVVWLGIVGVNVAASWGSRRP